MDEEEFRGRLVRQLIYLTEGIKEMTKTNERLAEAIRYQAKERGDEFYEGLINGVIERLQKKRVRNAGD